MENLAERNPLQIMIVDDVPINRRVLGLLLSRLGYRPDLAESGSAVLSMLSRRTYDLIFMDINMPDMDGIATIRQIRSLPTLAHQPRIVAVTGNLQWRKAEIVTAGADGVMVKPVHFHQLKRMFLLDDRQPSPHSPAVSHSTADILDQKIVQSLISLDDGDFIRDLVETADRELPTEVDLLETALRSGTADSAIAHAHRLRGAAATLGGRDLATQAGIMECLARRGDLEAPLDHLVAIRSTLSLTLLELRRLASKPPNAQVGPKMCNFRAASSA
ncbi:response regulator [bacterium]|nr:response regulator [bacterium]